jgi:hypothetical protein
MKGKVENALHSQTQIKHEHHLNKTKISQNVTLKSFSILAYSLLFVWFSGICKFVG